MKLVKYLIAAVPVILYVLILSALINANAYAGGMGVTRYHITSESGWIRRTPPPYGIGGIHRVREYSGGGGTAAVTLVRARREPPLLRHSISAVLNDTTHFDFDRSRLRPGGRDVMAELLERLQALNPGYGMGRYGFVTGIELIGHTDNIGSQSYNDRLGQRRADAVLAYLESQGIRSRNVRVTSRGENAPIASNETEAGRALNRRTEIIVHMVTVPEWR